MTRANHSYPLPPAPERLATAYLFRLGRGGEARPIFASWANHLSVEPIDQVVLESDSKLSIELVREFSRQLQLSPAGGAWRLGMIPHAERLTPEAGNALLKLLEDPPRHAVMLLGVEQEEQLLPTIVSRCQRWLIRDKKLEIRDKMDMDIAVLQKMNYRERFALAEEWAKSDQFLARFDALLLSAREAFLRGAFPVALLDRLLTYRSYAETNVSVRLLAEVTLTSLGKTNTGSA